MSRPLKGFVDLYLLKEDERIQLIGEQARQQLVGVFLERDEVEKQQRYIKKVEERFPGVKLIKKKNGPVLAVIVLYFGIPQ